MILWPFESQNHVFSNVGLRFFMHIEKLCLYMRSPGQLLMHIQIKRQANVKKKPARHLKAPFAHRSPPGRRSFFSHITKASDPHDWDIALQSIILEQIWAPGWAPWPCFGPKRGCSRPGMSCFFDRTWAPGPVWAKRCCSQPDAF